MQLQHGLREIHAALLQWPVFGEMGTWIRPACEPRAGGWGGGQPPVCLMLLGKAGLVVLRRQVDVLVHRAWQLEQPGCVPEVVYAVQLVLALFLL